MQIMPTKAKQNIAASLQERSRLYTERSMRAIYVYFKYIKLGEVLLIELPGGGIFEHDIPSLVVEFISVSPWWIIRSSVPGFTLGLKEHMLRFACHPLRLFLNPDNNKLRAESLRCQHGRLCSYMNDEIECPLVAHSVVLTNGEDWSECKMSILKRGLRRHKDTYDNVLLKLGDSGCFNAPIPTKGRARAPSLAQYILDQRIGESLGRTLRAEAHKKRLMEAMPDPETLVGTSFRICTPSLQRQLGTGSATVVNGRFVGTTGFQYPAPVSNTIINWRVIGFRGGRTSHAPYSLLVTPDSDLEEPIFECKMRLRGSWRLDVSTLAPKFIFDSPRVDLLFWAEWIGIKREWIRFDSICFQRGYLEVWKCPLTFNMPPLASEISDIVFERLGITIGAVPKMTYADYQRIRNLADCICMLGPVHKNSRGLYMHAST